MSFLSYLSSKDTQGPFLATKSFLPKLENSLTPRVINISSDFASISGKAIHRIILCLPNEIDLIAYRQKMIGEDVSVTVWQRQLSISKR